MLRISPYMASSGSHLYWTSDRKLYNYVSSYYTFFPHIIWIFGTNSGLRSRFNFFFTYTVPVYAKRHPKHLVPFDLSIWWSRFAVKHSPSHTNACIYTLKKPLSFSTEINVYSIPNVLCMRQYVWSRLYLAWGLRLRCFCGETERQGEGDDSGSDEPRNTHAYLEGRGK